MRHESLVRNECDAIASSISEQQVNKSFNLDRHYASFGEWANGNQTSALVLGYQSFSKLLMFKPMIGDVKNL